MRFKPKPLTSYERSFVIGSGFLAGSAFVFCGHTLLSGIFPSYAYVFYFATLIICLQMILRYFIVTRVFHTERNLWAWSTSMMISLVIPITVYEAFSGAVWFLCVVGLLILGCAKTLQSKSAIRESAVLSTGVRVTLSRIQVGVCWYQCYIGLLMIGFWAASTKFFGNHIATEWFGVSDLVAWRSGVSTLGGIVCLLASAHLALRILAWHREYLRMYPPTTTIEVPGPALERNGPLVAHGGSSVDVDRSRSL